MDLKLADKSILVTGGASGIGDAIVRSFAAEGARPIAVDINEKRLEQQRAELTTAGFDMDFIVADLSTGTGVTQMVDAVLDRLGGAPDVLVNNVGKGSLRNVDEASVEDFQETFELNFYSMLRASKSLVPLMHKRGNGSVVCVTSDLSRQPEDSITDYAATKAAVASVAKSMSRHYAPNVRVNCVAPGPILTPFWSDENYGWQKTVEAAYGKSGPEALDALISDRGIPMGRMGTPDEVAAAVVFLASDVSGFTTGATLGVDGGSIRHIF